VGGGGERVTSSDLNPLMPSVFCWQQEGLYTAGYEGHYRPLSEIHHAISFAVKLQPHRLQMPCGSKSISPTTAALKIKMHSIKKKF